MAREYPMTSVLQALCADHANFAKLLNVVEQQAACVSSGMDPDAEVLVQAVDYLAGYPAAYHHPIEDTIYEMLKTVDPASSASVDATLQGHRQIRANLEAFTELLGKVRQGSVVARSAFARAAQEFVDAEWAHMEHERANLFPRAQAAFSDSDWAAVERAVARIEDPLFGAKPASRLRELHNALLECATRDQTLDALSR